MLITIEIPDQFLGILVSWPSAAKTMIMSEEALDSMLQEMDLTRQQIHYLKEAISDSERIRPALGMVFELVKLQLKERQRDLGINFGVK